MYHDCTFIITHQWLRLLHAVPSLSFFSIWERKIQSHDIVCHLCNCSKTQQWWVIAVREHFGNFWPCHDVADFLGLDHNSCMNLKRNWLDYTSDIQKSLRKHQRHWYPIDPTKFRQFSYPYHPVSNHILRLLLRLRYLCRERPYVCLQHQSSSKDWPSE